MSKQMIKVEAKKQRLVFHYLVRVLLFLLLAAYFVQNGVVDYTDVAAGKGGFKVVYVLVVLALVPFILSTLYYSKVSIPSRYLNYFVCYAVMLFCWSALFNNMGDGFLPFLMLNASFLFMYFTLLIIYRYFELKGFVLSATVIALFYNAYVAMYSRKVVDGYLEGGTTRFCGTFIDPNYFALVEVFFIAVSLIYLLYYAKYYRTTILVAVNIPVCCMLIIASLSRSGMLAMGIFLLSFVLSLPALKASVDKVRFKRAIWYALLPICMVAALYVVKTGVLSDVDNLLNLIQGRFTGESGDSAALSRVWEIQGTLDYFADHVWSALVGIGLGATESAPWWLNEYNAVTQTRVHNTTVSLILENGVIGFALMLMTLITSYKVIAGLKHSVRLILRPLFFAAIVASQFVWTIYFMPFWFCVLLMPLLAQKEFGNAQ